MGVKVHFKGDNTIKKLLVAPKDRDNITQKSRVIYTYKCDRLECDEKYIAESARTIGEMSLGTSQGPCPIYDQANTTGNHSRVDNSIVGRGCTTSQEASRRPCT